MPTKIPPDAFEYYLGLGPGRSYETVARKYGVSKRAVTKLAAKEDWQQCILDIQRKARRASENRAVESLEMINERHLKALRIIQGKALEALRAMPLNTAMEAVRALELSIKTERVVHGLPGDRTATTVEETIRGEYERWMVVSERRQEVTDDHNGNPIGSA